MLSLCFFLSISSCSTQDFPWVASDFAMLSFWFRYKKVEIHTPLLSVSALIMVSLLVAGHAPSDPSKGGRMHEIFTPNWSGKFLNFICSRVRTYTCFYWHTNPFPLFLSWSWNKLSTVLFMRITEHCYIVNLYIF
jgi:hypothetical protein